MAAGYTIDAHWAFIRQKTRAPQMWKKLLLVGVVAALAVGIFKGSKMYNRASDEIAAMEDSYDDSVPVEKKIAAMRKETAKLDKDIDKAKNELAKEIVEVRELNTKVTETRASVDADQKILAARGEAIKDATTKVKYGNSTVSVAEANSRLSKDVDILIKRKKSLEGMEKALATRERVKETLKKQLDGLVRQQQEMKAEIDAVEADYKALQLAQIESKYQQDDSRLAKIKEDLRKLKKNLDVQKEKLDMAPIGQTDEATEARSVDDNINLLNGKKPAGEEITKSDN